MAGLWNKNIERSPYFTPYFMKTIFMKIAFLFLAFHIASVCPGNITFAQTGATSTVTDADGNIYRTLKIGNQTWMIENLRTTKYNDGSPITAISDIGDLRNSLLPAYSVHSANESYGHLYNWFSVNTHKLAPKGWRIPGKQDWNVPIGYLGGPSLAGGKLKTGYGPGNKQSLFNIFYAGYIAYDGRFVKMDNVACWYSATEGRGGETGDSYRIEKTKEHLFWGSFDKRFFMSVRCIKNN